MDNFIIRKAKTMSDVKSIVEIQKRAWDMGDEGVVPSFEMKAVIDSGVVLVAVDSTDTPVGFIYAFDRIPDIHYSHMMGILPEWQSKNVGFRLKEYHRNIALQNKYPINQIQWTVDPLLPNNAYLNFTKLGCVCSTYKVDYYGDPNSDSVGIYAGVPTDRFLVQWFIRDERVDRRMNDYTIDRVSLEKLLVRSPSINFINHDAWISLDNKVENSFTVEVPSNYQLIRQTNLSLANDWRIKLRDVCVNYFQDGWEVLDYHSFKDGDIRRNFYEFRRKNT
ncbi:MAG: hypothetical protein OEY49_05895 [Candidatus Heimdallarchaeota archaeon]|nr:hypothetical protein [Candidatus Heimdallarchaeota archaeon]